MPYFSSPLKGYFNILLDYSIFGFLRHTREAQDIFPLRCLSLWLARKRPRFLQPGSRFFLRLSFSYTECLQFLRVNNSTPCLGFGSTVVSLPCMDTLGSSTPLSNHYWIHMVALPHEPPLGFLASATLTLSSSHHGACRQRHLPWTGAPISLVAPKPTLLILSIRSCRSVPHFIISPSILDFFL